MIGALFSGQLADIIGRRWTLVVALAVSFAAITIEFIATTNEVFFAGKFVNGFAVGTIQATSGTYIGEVCTSLMSAAISNTDVNGRSFLLLLEVL